MGGASFCTSMASMQTSKAPQQQAAPSTTLTQVSCPSGHALTTLRSMGRSTCVTCRTKVPVGATVHACPICNVEACEPCLAASVASAPLCSACGEKEVTLGSSASQESCASCRRMKGGACGGKGCTFCQAKVGSGQKTYTFKRQLKKSFQSKLWSSERHARERTRIRLAKPLPQDIPQHPIAGDSMCGPCAGKGCAFCRRIA